MNWLSSKWANALAKKTQYAKVYVPVSPLNSWVMYIIMLPPPTPLFQHKLRHLAVFHISLHSWWQSIVAHSLDKFFQNFSCFIVVRAICLDNDVPQRIWSWKKEFAVGTKLNAESSTSQNSNKPDLSIFGVNSRISRTLERLSSKSNLIPPVQAFRIILFFFEVYSGLFPAD